MSGIVADIFRKSDKAGRRIEPGSVVRLNSGAPSMTVFTEEHYKATTCQESLPAGSVCVGYWLDNKLHMNVMPESALTVVAPAPTETEDDA